MRLYAVMRRISRVNDAEVIALTGRHLNPERTASIVCLHRLLPR